MKILITGACGFIGSNLARILLKNGQQVIGIDNLTRGSLKNIDDIYSHPMFKFVQVDLCDYDKLLLEITKQIAPNTVSEVWHMAANSDIPAGIENPMIDLNNTFYSTFNIIRLMDELKIKVILFASTSAVYGDLGNVRLSEDTGPLFPISNYGAMKLASEASISAAVEKFIERAYIFRFPNVVGVPATHGVIFDLINKLKQTPNELHVLGNGTQKKVYLHVDELIEAMLFIKNKCTDRINYFNIGPNDDGCSVQYIAEQVLSSSFSDARIKYGIGNKGWSGDVPTFIYSIDKLSALGWSPKLDSKSAIQRAIKEIIEFLA
jgi:UDP-glucose 4-epimerase